jgi:hypothetical protein
LDPGVRPVKVDTWCGIQAVWGGGAEEGMQKLLLVSKSFAVYIGKVEFSVVRRTNVQPDF